jgi:hypothetical protein
MNNAIKSKRDKVDKKEIIITNKKTENLVTDPKVK